VTDMCPVRGHVPLAAGTALVWTAPAWGMCASGCTQALPNSIPPPRAANLIGSAKSA
jgi:hypothetical protein